MALILNNLSSVSTLCLLLIIASLQISQLKGEQTASGSGTCPNECNPGYKCVSGKCERRNCTRNCTGVPTKLVCGSDGVTYNNLCELRKQRCVKAKEITDEYLGACITLPPPPNHICSAYQRQWDGSTMSEYTSRCDYTRVQNKGREGTLTFEDVRSCYRPQCNNDKYASQQCSFHAPNWCWCASEEGHLIPDTFEENKPAGACSQRKMCVYDGVKYKDGDLFTPQSQCGLCECLNGNVTCFEDYVPHVDDEDNELLNSTQIAKLKTELVLLFYFQENHKEHILIDIRHIHKYPTTVTESTSQNIVRKKFNNYDKNKDGVLYPAEQYVFRTELYEFVRCSRIFDHVTKLIDEDSNKIISRDEWNRFFDENTSSGSTSGSTSDSANGPEISSPVKRSVPSSSLPVMRKPLHLRKKFQYVLF